MDETQGIREAEAQYGLSEAVSQKWTLGRSEEEIVARVRAIIANDERISRARLRDGLPTPLRAE